MVGTPGRVLDLARAGDLELKGVRVVVVDEADRMLVRVAGGGDGSGCGNAVPRGSAPCEAPFCNRLQCHLPRCLRRGRGWGSSWRSCGG